MKNMRYAAITVMVFLVVVLNIPAFADGVPAYVIHGTLPSGEVYDAYFADAAYTTWVSTDMYYMGSATRIHYRWLMASDSGVRAGTSLNDRQAFWIGRPPTRSQMYLSNVPNSA